MTTSNLSPVSEVSAAEAALCALAKRMLALVAATLHHQFPTGAYLVLTRPVDGSDDDSVRLDSVRAARGEIVWSFTEKPHEEHLLPAVSEEIEALWGDSNPRNTDDVLNLIQRVDRLALYEFLQFLPEECQTEDEIEDAEGWGRTPLGIALGPASEPTAPGASA
ncbi:hypothetical protein [Streptomyces similanensis]|uniref:Uncharacterized protein n=1 Tax=Streptomyces similanensis TaxID=1274988 RepID=A0ABP9L7R5_9ACTN